MRLTQCLSRHSILQGEITRDWYSKDCECLVAESLPLCARACGSWSSSLFMYNWCGKRLYFDAYWANASSETFLSSDEGQMWIFKVEFFVVAAFLWSNGVIIRINMHREATRNPHMAPWGWGEGRKKYFFLSLMFYDKNIFFKAPCWALIRNL